MALPSAAFLYPVRFAATTYVLRVVANGTTTDLTFPASGTLDSETDYWMIGDGSATDLLALLDACLESHAAINTATTTYDSSDYLSTVLSLTGGTAQILWAHANTTLDDAVFGYSGSSSAGTTLVGTLVPQGIVLLEQAPSDDSRNRTAVVGGSSVSISGLARTSTFTTPRDTRNLLFDLLPQSKALIEYADADEPTGTVEYMWLNAMSLGRQLRYCEDDSDLSTYETYRARPPLTDPLVRSDRYIVKWSATFPLVEAS